MSTVKQSQEELQHKHGSVQHSLKSLHVPCNFSVMADEMRQREVRRKKWIRVDKEKGDAFQLNSFTTFSSRLANTQTSFNFCSMLWLSMGVKPCLSRKGKNID
jgi:hypothetical protein